MNFICRDGGDAEFPAALDGKAAGGDAHPFAEAHGQIIRLRTCGGKCGVGHILHDDDIIPAAFFHKFDVKGRETVIAADHKETDFWNQVFIELGS